MNSNRVAIPARSHQNRRTWPDGYFYLSRRGHRRVAVFQSAGLLDDISSRKTHGQMAAKMLDIPHSTVRAAGYLTAASVFATPVREMTYRSASGGGGS